MEYRDKTLDCVSCGRPFLFTATEQFVHAGRGFRHEPKRCVQCRDRKRAGAEPGTTITCAQCGREAVVPFRPTQGRPVLCQTCYAERPARA